MENMLAKNAKMPYNISTEFLSILLFSDYIYVTQKLSIIITFRTNKTTLLALDIYDVYQHVYSRRKEFTLT